ncbi:MAG: hypothetical protein LBK61_02530 [Spirochaetaceae bacterium]|jgi:hypothetical protein|nr:hypothetical protein [Spirochaetaceae bacterium]
MAAITSKHIITGAWLAALLAACGGMPRNAEAPPWARNVEAAYPRAAFIAQRGEGATRREAELAALNSISFYFESEIDAEESMRRSWTERNGVAGTESRTETSTLVRSQTRLVAVRYAEDPWVNPATKAWETVAFIDREEAWTVYEPEAAKARDALLALSDASEVENEAFLRALRFGAAAAYGEGAGFNAVRGFAQILHPAKAQTLFASADALRAAFPERIYSARQGAAVFVDCPDDLDGLVATAVAAAFGTAGFPVTQDRRTASGVCLVRVDLGAQKLESGTFYTPALTGTVSGGAGTVFSFTAKAPRQSAMNPDIGRRRAYTALAAALGEAFAAELDSKQASYNEQ